MLVKNTGSASMFLTQTPARSPPFYCVLQLSSMCKSTSLDHKSDKSKTQAQIPPRRSFRERARLNTGLWLHSDNHISLHSAAQICRQNKKKSKSRAERCTLRKICCILSTHTHTHAHTHTHSHDGWGGGGIIRVSHNDT